MIRRHFHTFDAFRFFSFLLVFTAHIQIPEFSFAFFFSQSGRIGVSFFFVLSGFLISYILLSEKKENGKISLKNFFIRRILRIWPLYYAMILFAFLTPYMLSVLKLSHSDEGYQPQWLVSVFFLENYRMMLTDSFANVSPLRIMWSLCVEEHFYIIWGILFFFIPLKRIPQLIAVCILLANIVRIIYYHFNIDSLDVFSNLDYFAFGAIPAYILLFRNELIDKVGKLSLTFKYSVVVIAVVAVFTFSNFHPELLNYFSPAILAILFSLMILFTLPAFNAVYITERSVFSVLGKYTYGLYLYHVIVINLLLQTIRLLPFAVHWVVMGIVALLLSIIISIASYHLFEKQFLKLKKYFY